MTAGRFSLRLNMRKFQVAPALLLLLLLTSTPRPSLHVIFSRPAKSSKAGESGGGGRSWLDLSGVDEQQSHKAHVLPILSTKPVTTSHRFHTSQKQCLSER